jgi:hypothetical protein
MRWPTWPTKARWMCYSTISKSLSNALSDSSTGAGELLLPLRLGHAADRRGGGSGASVAVHGGGAGSHDGLG